MCWAALALTAAGALTSEYAKQRALSNQDDAALAALRRQEAFSDRANNVVQQAIQHFAPAAQRQQAREQAQTQLGNAFSNALNDARIRGQGVIAPTSQGAVSSEYTTAKAKALADQIQQAADAARLAAATAAPGLARQQTGYELADVGNQLGLIGGAARGQAGVDANRISQAGRVNPWLEALGGALGGAGQGALLGYAYGGAPATGTVTQPAASVNGGQLLTYKLPKVPAMQTFRTG